ncbi:MAG TPA: YihY/virulence factor BrkB family protein [Xanthobacteraceae bacterium]
MGRAYRIAMDAFWRFNDDDGWAIASHIALSALMSMFPFLIVVTALAAFFGSKELADETARLMLEAWPKEVAGPIAEEIRDVLTNLRTDVLTFGVLAAVYFSTSGIDSLRIGLNRAYGMKEPRRWWWLRLESIGYVLVGAAALLAFSFLIVLWPLLWATAMRFFPALPRLDGTVTLVRYGLTSAVIVVTLVIVHLWLPAGRRRLAEVVPGILVTLALWLVSGAVFGRYLADFAYTYVTIYAGLASAMIALVFLYLVASIFVYGGELNAAIARERARRGNPEN